MASEIVHSSPVGPDSGGAGGDATVDEALNVESKAMDPDMLMKVAGNTCKVAEQIYNDFNPGQHTLDTHLDLAVAEHDVRSATDEVFLRQVVYGAERYSDLLAAFSAAFYHHCGGAILRQDRQMYLLYTYLAVIRIEELGNAQFAALVRAQDAQKMVPWFEFLFSNKHLENTLRQEWIKIYDKGFVDERIGVLSKKRQQLQDLFTALRASVFAATEAAGSTVEAPPQRPPAPLQVTEPKPFNLSMPKPRPAAAEPPPPSLPPAKPPPKRHEGPTKEKLALEATAAANRARIMAQQSRRYAPELSTSQRPGTRKIEQLRAQLEAEQLAESAPLPRARPAPAEPTAEVRVNAAAILREDAVYRRKQAAEAAALQRYEAELRDDAQYCEWQTRMKAADDEQRLEEAEIKRIEARLAREAAILAVETQTAEKLDAGREQKAHAQALEGARRAELAAMRADNAAKQQRIVQERQEMRAAVASAADGNRDTADALRAALRDSARRFEEEQAKQLAQRQDLIRQLRAAERVPKERVAVFDASETAGHGLLEEMSIQELRERLVVVKRREREECERTRSLIMRQKEATRSSLCNKVERLARVRQVANAQAQLRKENKVRERAAAESARRRVHESSVIKLADKLEAKRGAIAAERARLAAEEKRIAFLQQQHASGAKQVEASKFRELRAGAERSAAARQRSHLADATEAAQTQRRSRQVELRHRQAQQAAKRDFVRAYDARLAEVKGAHAAQQGREAAQRQQLAASQRGQEALARSQRAAAAYSPTARPAESSMQARLQALAAGMEIA